MGISLFGELTLGPMSIEYNFTGHCPVRLAEKYCSLIYYDRKILFID